MGETQEKWVTPWNGLALTWKYYPQLKTQKDDGGGWGEEPRKRSYPEKLGKHEWKVVMQMKVTVFSTDRHS